MYKYLMCFIIHIQRERIRWITFAHYTIYSYIFYIFFLSLCMYVHIHEVTTYNTQQRNAVQLGNKTLQRCFWICEAILLTAWHNASMLQRRHTQTLSLCSHTQTHSLTGQLHDGLYKLLTYLSISDAVKHQLLILYHTHTHTHTHKLVRCGTL